MDGPDEEQLAPVKRLVDPNAPVAMATALAKSMFPYLQQPEGPASFQPNTAGKIPEVDPLAGPAPYAQGAVDFASMLGPGAAEKGLSLSALHLVPLLRRAVGPENVEQAVYHAVNDAGDNILKLKSSLHPKTKDLFIDWVGRYDPEYPSGGPFSMDYDPEAVNSVGPSEIRSLLKALRKEYPEMKSISGQRVSGARREPEFVTIPVKKGLTTRPNKE